MSIEESLIRVRENIRQAAELAGKTEKDITLVAVSKFKSVEEIDAAIKCGARDFGENYIQEFCDKYSKINEPSVQWHIIGNVQRNKVKYIADKNIIVQTVDKESLAAELSKHAAKHNKVIPVLLQVNTAGEETKSGVAPDELIQLMESVLPYENIEVNGLMTIGPNTDDEYEIEACFEDTYKLFEEMKSHEKIKGQIKQLSMGMTNDYALAIKHGANIVRVGRAIFGDRT